MEITKRARFVQDFYGGKAFLPGDQLVRNWLESQQDRLLHPRFAQLKDALGNETKLEEILSVFNVNGDNEPIIGNWMLHECSMDASKLAGTWTRYKVSFDVWENSVQFSPVHVPLQNNGSVIKEGQFVEVYTVTVKRGKNKGNSFFKAYQGIMAGAEFEFKIEYPDDLCTKIEGKGKNKQIMPDPEKSTECVNSVLDKMATIGCGAYRRRFGSFEYV